jgi:hypothetical protein
MKSTTLRFEVNEAVGSGASESCHHERKEVLFCADQELRNRRSQSVRKTASKKAASKTENISSNFH